MDRETRWDNFIQENLVREMEKLNFISPLVVEFADLIKSDESGKILDLGCGLGRHMHYLSHRGFNVLGFDISEKTLMRAEELAKTANLKLDFVRGDYMDLPFHNGVFQGVISISTLHHDFPDSIYSGFREIRRVLNFGGYFALDPLSVNDGRFGQGRALGEKLYIMHKVPHYFFEEDELLNLLERLFFKVVVMKKYSNKIEGADGKITSERFHVIARKTRRKRKYIPPLRHMLL
ncbi:MAG: class I SAM-dependent methyltransferase [Candidatus Eremiobacteraeota bacterium]|nr:class I SAM-dependent methyltransferase [Candidatus Eremiobacteraeota bacterium]